MSFARRNTFCLGGVLGLLCLLASAISIFTSKQAQSAPQVPVWSEVKWPFLLDQWGAGRAFRCAAEQCGSEVHVYLRAKIGFCRCATGVSDDDEIDRVGDVELIGDDYKPLASGRPITAGILVGRARLFLVERPYQSSVSVLAVALANKCDAIAATVVAEPDIQTAQERAALEFLRSDIVQQWAQVNTGLPN
jgi:hypothetical protein